MELVSYQQRAPWVGAWGIAGVFEYACRLHRVSLLTLMDQNLCMGLAVECGKNLSQQRTSSLMTSIYLRSLGKRLVSGPNPKSACLESF